MKGDGKKPIDCTNLLPFLGFSITIPQQVPSQRKKCGGFRQSKKVYGVTGRNNSVYIGG
jgi:hypothetical protein